MKMKAEFSAAIFPGLLEPAKEAARKLLDDNLSEVEIEGRGLWVAKKEDVHEMNIHHTFIQDGVEFAIFEQTFKGEER